MIPCMEASWTWPAVGALLIVSAMIISVVLVQGMVLSRFVQRMDRTRRDDLQDGPVLFVLFLCIVLGVIFGFVVLQEPGVRFLAAVKCPGMFYPSVAPVGPGS